MMRCAQGLLVAEYNLPSHDDTDTRRGGKGEGCIVPVEAECTLILHPDTSRLDAWLGFRRNQKSSIAGRTIGSAITGGGVLTA